MNWRAELCDAAGKIRARRARPSRFSHHQSACMRSLSSFRMTKYETVCLRLHWGGKARRIGYSGIAPEKVLRTGCDRRKRAEYRNAHAITERAGDFIHYREHRGRGDGGNCFSGRETANGIA